MSKRPDFPTPLRLALAALVALACGQPRVGFAAEEARAASGEVLVSAAISLKAPLEDARKALEASSPGTKVTLNLGASGTLLAQIEKGAPADLFLSASTEEIDRLEKGGKLVAGSRTELASNRLVVGLATGEPPLASFSDLRRARFQRIAIGNPATVPAGRYAREAFTSQGLWGILAPRLIFAENVRQVLDYVARGEVDAGLVYRTDIALLPGKVVAGPEAPSGSHAPIRYQGAIPSEAPHAGLARQFLEFLASSDGQSILANHGFLPPARP